MAIVNISVITIFTFVTVLLFRCVISKYEIFYVDEGIGNFTPSSDKEGRYPLNETDYISNRRLNSCNQREACHPRINYGRASTLVLLESYEIKNLVDCNLEIIEIKLLLSNFTEANISFDIYNIAKNQSACHCIEETIDLVRLKKENVSEKEWIPILRYGPRKTGNQLKLEGEIIGVSMKNDSGYFFVEISMLSLFDDSKCNKEKNSYPFVYSVKSSISEDLIFVNELEKNRNLSEKVNYQIYQISVKDGEEKQVASYNALPPKRIAVNIKNNLSQYFYYLNVQLVDDSYEDFLSARVICILAAVIVLLVIIVSVIAYASKITVCRAKYLYCQCSKHGPNRKVLEYLIKFLEAHCYIKEYKQAVESLAGNVSRRFIRDSNRRQYDCIIFILFPSESDHDIDCERSLEDLTKSFNNTKKKILVRLPKKINQKVDREQCPWAEGDYREFLLLHDLQKLLEYLHPCIYPMWLQKYLRPKLWFPYLEEQLKKYLIRNADLKLLCDPNLYPNDDDETENLLKKIRQKDNSYEIQELAL